MLQKLKDNLYMIPVWRRRLYTGLVVISVVYVGWSFYHQPPLPEGVFHQPVAAVDTPKIPGPVLQVPIKIIPKAVIKKEYPEYHAADSPVVEVVDTAVIPPSENGGTTITHVDTSTGDVVTSYEPEKAPWFAPQDKNYLGISVGGSTSDGMIGRGYYKRDILRVKDVFLQVEGDVMVRPDAPTRQVEGVAWVNAEYRW
jgi:hypothetical protein